MPSTVDLDQYAPTHGALSPTEAQIHFDTLADVKDGASSDLLRQIIARCGCLVVGLQDEQTAMITAAIDKFRLFALLPDDHQEKSPVAAGDRDYGWSAKFNEPAYQPGTISSLESFDVSTQHIAAPGDPVWPGSAGLYDPVTRCWNLYASIAARVFGALERLFGLECDTLAGGCSSGELDTLRLLHYSPQAENDSENRVGIAAHTDFECITLLYQSRPGLEILTPSGNWLEVPASPASVVVLFGDMLERWTNGTILATGHRVRNTDEHRYSVVRFFAADRDQLVQPLDKFRTASTDRYPPVRQEQHITQEVARAEENRQRVQAADLDMADS